MIYGFINQKILKHFDLEVLFYAPNCALRPLFSMIYDMLKNKIKLYKTENERISD